MCAVQILKRSSCRRHRQCKGPEEGVFLACLRNSRRPRWLEQGEGGEQVGEEVREGEAFKDFGFSLE